MKVLMACEEFAKSISTIHPKNLSQKQAIEICLHMDECTECRTKIQTDAMIADLMGCPLSQEKIDATTKAGRDAAKANFQGGVN